MNLALEAVRPATSAFALALLLLSPGGRGAADDSAPPHPPVDLLIVRDGWGKASLADVRKVLESAADALWRHFPGRTLEPIVVRPKGGPVTAFQRGPGGEYFVCLSTGDTMWSQYAYQFAHEFGHILCGYDTDPHGQRWFEESLCELASLYAVRRMGESWQTAPPYPNWRDYAPNLTRYAQDLLDKGRLPEGTSLAQWYAQAAAELEKNATDRERNRVVAVALLPLFERSPEHWRAVSWLNTGKADKPQTFREYLTDWWTHCPEDERLFVMEVARQFGLELG